MENHKILIAIPIILALLSLVLIGFNGLEQGVDLKGGSLAETIRLLWNWKTISIQVHLQAP